MAAVAGAELGVTEADLNAMNDTAYSETIGRALYLERRRNDAFATAVARGIAAAFGGEPI